MAAPAVAAAPCPECGVENAADHNYCKHCGAPLREVVIEREFGTGLAERTRDRCLALLRADPDNAGLHYNLGLASAQAVVLFFIVLLLTVVQFAIAQRWVFYR